MTAPIRAHAPFSPKFVQIEGRTYRVVDRSTGVEVCMVWYEESIDGEPARWIAARDGVKFAGSSRAEALEILLRSGKPRPETDDTVTITPIAGKGESVDTEPGLQPWTAIFMGTTTDGKAIVIQDPLQPDTLRVIPMNIVTLTAKAGA